MEVEEMEIRRLDQMDSCYKVVEEVEMENDPFELFSSSFFEEAILIFVILRHVSFLSYYDYELSWLNNLSKC
jgi:hypothetical protein